MCLTCAAYKLQLMMDTGVLWEDFDWPASVPAKFPSCDHRYRIPTEFPQAQYIFKY